MEEGVDWREGLAATLRAAGGGGVGAASVVVGAAAAALGRDSAVFACGALLLRAWLNLS